MFTLTFNDHRHGVTKVTSYDDFYDGYDDMVHQWNKLVNLSIDADNGYATVLDYRLGDEWPCYCEEGDGYAYAVLTRLGNKVADYTWTLKEE